MVFIQPYASNQLLITFNQTLVDLRVISVLLRVKYLNWLDLKVHHLFSIWMASVSVNVSKTSSKYVQHLLISQRCTTSSSHTLCTTPMLKLYKPTKTKKWNWTIKLKKKTQMDSMIRISKKLRLKRLPESLQVKD